MQISDKQAKAIKELIEASEAIIKGDYWWDYTDDEFEGEEKTIETQEAVNNFECAAGNVKGLLKEIL